MLHYHKEMVKNITHISNNAERFGNLSGLSHSGSISYHIFCEPSWYEKYFMLILLSNLCNNQL